MIPPDAELTERHDEIPSGTHQVRVEFTYDGGGLGKGADVAPDYPEPNAFSGEVSWVEIALGGDAEDADHFISADERVQIAIARQ